jgi:hypothetical protein
VTFDTLGPRDQAYIVDLTTMTILDFIEGSFSPQTDDGGTGAAANSAGQAIAEMHTLLGK